MDPLQLIETQPGQFSLLLSDASTARSINDEVEQHGHLPNGYFWEGVARTLIRQRAPQFTAAVQFDCEAGMFCAYGSDRAALEHLGQLMAGPASDPDALRELLRSADPADFDD